MSDAGKSGTNTRFEGWSDYAKVADRVAQSVYDAVEAYAVLQARHTENARIRPELASEARSQIHGPAIRLKTEMEREKGRGVEMYEEILERWEGENGYLNRFEDISLQDQCPGWLGDFVEDIRSAGYELGYLQAGRTVKEPPEDPVEEETESMFDNL